MKNRFFLKQILLLLLFLIGLNSISKSQSIKNRTTGTLQIIVVPMFSDSILKTEKQICITPHGDTVSIDLVKMYLSHFILSAAKTNFTEPESYHLINTETNSLVFEIKNIPADTFDAINFTIGVDSLANVSGAMGGDLDPANGMYWAWNTGYIMAKMEGQSSACKTIHHLFEFHIGGFLEPNKVERKVNLKTNCIKIDANKTTLLVLKMDVSKWFTGKHEIDLSKTNSVLMPSKAAMDIADNYMAQFSILEIINPK